MENLPNKNRFFVDKQVYICYDIKRICKGLIVVKLKYDVKKLEELAKDYSVVAGGIRIRIIDLNIEDENPNIGVIASSPYKRPEFCQKMLSCKESELKCKEIETHTTQNRSFNDVFTATPCHAGIVEAMYPIVKDNKKIGYILFSAMRTKDNIYDFAKELNYPLDDIEELNKIYQKMEYYDEERIECIGRIAAILASYIMSDSIVSVEYDALTKQAMDYIEENLGKPLKVSDICKALNISKTALYNMFRTSLNCTVNEFITNKRLSRSKILLTTTDKPIVTVSEEIGFTDYTYFCKLFKKSMGVTPLKYRKTHR